MLAVALALVFLSSLDRCDAQSAYFEAVAVKPA
jgi:hypothetical protein